MAYTAIPPVSGGGSGAVDSIVAGSGITVSGATGNVTVANELIVGKATTQTMNFGSGTGVGGVIKSNTSSDGLVTFGATDKMVWNEAATDAVAATILTIGTRASTSGAGTMVGIYGNRSGTLFNIVIGNTHTGTNSSAELNIGNNGTHNNHVRTLGSSWTTVGDLVAGSLELYGADANSNVLLGKAANTGKVVIYCGSARTQRIVCDQTGIGFFATAPVAQQTVGANVNNVAASGTTGQFDDFTNGSVYATDYAALHATVYQLTRSVAQLTVAVRNLGLGA